MNEMHLGGKVHQINIIAQCKLSLSSRDSASERHSLRFSADPGANCVLRWMAAILAQDDFTSTEGFLASMLVSDEKTLLRGESPAHRVIISAH